MPPPAQSQPGTHLVRLNPIAAARKGAALSSPGVFASGGRDRYKAGVKKQPVTSVEQPIGASQRVFLFFTAALTGAAIMIIEILGAKMLAPYVGTSHFVWTAQIAVTLVALAVGYYVGGRLADRSRQLGRLYACIFAAAVYLCIAVWLTEPVAYGCLKFRLATGSLLASAFLYFVPLGLLAMVGPYLIRVLTNALAGVGSNVGRLTALSTIGSFLGTILIGYVLIPFLPNSVTMTATASILMLIAAGYFFAWGKRQHQIVIFVALLAGLSLGFLTGRPQPPRHSSEVELYHANSNYGLLQVLQISNSPIRLYRNDYLVQNTFDTNTQKSTSMFTYMLHDLAQAYTAKIEEVLCIGLGIGIVPMDFAREGARVDVVEINSAVPFVAERFFALDPRKVNITIGDGRYFVATSQKKYDAVILDAFLGESSPAHLMSREAFSDMRRILRPAGVLVINCFGDFETGKDFFVASLEKTLKSAFRHVRIHNDYNGGNVFFVASEEELSIRRSPTFEHIPPHVSRQVQNAFDRIVETHPDHGIVLTDDYNPVEYYDAANREELRKRLALSMR